ncbi:hypothetical protein [Chitinophaga sp. YR573]|uniref:hypothetical protein n=1 Tax=Chitinophaga sp. YR573 TaxID=1881040 RepID=UPI00115FDD06|nr:hypothetical protein [Chitinophaga sp. YR573]
MKWFLNLLLLVLVFSCEEARKPAIVIPAHPGIEPKPFVYIERAHLNGKEYRVTFKSAFDFPDKLTQDTSFYLQGNYVMLYDKVKNSMDTARLDNADYFHSRLSLRDLSDSLHEVVFNIHWINDSDMPSDEFVVYDGNTLTTLVFAAPDSCEVADTIFNAGSSLP